MNSTDSSSLDQASAASRPRPSAARDAGDGQAENAVTALYQAHALGLTRLAHIMLGDKASAEDVVQEAFWGLYRNWAKLADPAGALPYLRASVLNGCRSAGGLAFNWTRLKISARSFGSCMAEAGFSQPSFSEPERAYVQAFPDNSQFPDLTQRAGTDSMSGPLYIATSPVAPKSAAGRRAVRRCTAASAQPFTRIDKITTPLEGPWLNMVTAVQSSAPVHALQPAFSACLQAHAIPAAYAQQQADASNPLFNGFFAWMDRGSLTRSSRRWP